MGDGAGAGGAGAVGGNGGAGVGSTRKLNSYIDILMHFFLVNVNTG